MNFVLELQSAPEAPADEDRLCNFVSLASCSLCSLSLVSIGLCLG